VSTRVTLAASIYPRDCLRSAAAAFEELCSARMVEESGGEYSVELIPASGAIDEKQLANEFLNYLLDLSAESYLEGNGGGRGAD
jgi:hypothetical protein